MKGNLTKVEDGMVIIDAKYFTVASGVMVPKYLPAYIEFDVESTDPTIINKIQILARALLNLAIKKPGVKNLIVMVDLKEKLQTAGSHFPW